MKLWAPLAVIGVVAAAYALFYVLSISQGAGGSSFGLVNSLGLVTVVIGLVAAMLIIKRAKPHQ